MNIYHGVKVSFCVLFYRFFFIYLFFSAVAVEELYLSCGGFVIKTLHVLRCALYFTFCLFVIFLQSKCICIIFLVDFLFFFLSRNEYYYMVFLLIFEKSSIGGKTTLYESLSYFVFVYEQQPQLSYIDSTVSKRFLLTSS